MEIQSETPGVVITRWDDPSSCRTPTAFVWRGDRNEEGVAYRYSELGVTRLQTSQSVRAPVAELARFAAGEGPPEPPIAVGDTVSTLDGACIVRALWGSYAWVEHPDHRAPLTLPLATLKRAER